MAHIVEDGAVTAGKIYDDAPFMTDAAPLSTGKVLDSSPAVTDVALPAQQAPAMGDAPAITESVVITNV